MDKKFSLITFNHGKAHFKHCAIFLKSTLQFVDDDDVEIVLVEKGKQNFNVPTDKNYKHVVYDKVPNYDKCRSLNKGAGVAVGEYLIFHDNDIPLPSDFFDKINDKVEEGHEFFPSYEKIHLLDIQLTSQIFKHSSSCKHGYAFLGNRLIQLTKGFGGSLVIKKTLFDAVGGWNENFNGWGIEDLELAHRVRYFKNYDLGAELVRAEQSLMHLYHKPVNSRFNQHYTDNINVFEKTEKNPEKVIEELTS